MPIQRFRDPEDARRALWVPRGDPTLGRRIRALWSRAALLAPPGIPRGLRKFASIEEANAEREVWVRARIRLLASRTAKVPPPA